MYKINQVICGLLLIVVPAVHAAAHYKLELQPGMFGTPGYPALPLGIPLTKANLSRPFFEQLRMASEEERKQVLMIAKTVPIAYDLFMKRDYWLIKRLNIAAALEVAGADPKWAQNGGVPDFLAQAVRMNDVPLVRLILEKGTNVDEKACGSDVSAKLTWECLHYEPSYHVIHWAETKEMAELLVEVGAMKHPNSATLLHVVMDSSRYPSDLVLYYAEQYIQNGIPFTAHDSQGDTIFTAAVKEVAKERFGCNYIDVNFALLKTIRSLLAIIPVADGLALINDTKNANGKQVREVIKEILRNEKKKSPLLKDSQLILKTLKNLLYDYVQDPHKYYKGLQGVESEQEADCEICDWHLHWHHYCLNAK